MSFWDKRAKLIIQDNEGNNIAIKNRFPSESEANQSLSTILERLRSGEIRYDSLHITVRGVQRERVPLLVAGTHDTASERD
ncbi:uncharacterized protein UTRI_06495 [Ustilago trichophora]|uniref:Uncharacterized protein n=1 Tax=Ustilago trichophora TaxID=86804 RepID=A0A5C3EMP2_9BASI|nr:uncharacterized protein UTRI_06495 [Ustilago trichophora]